MRIAELIKLGMSELQEANIPDCASDIYLLLGRVLKKSRTQLLAAAKETVPPAQIEQFQTLLKRRKKREPAAYILGEQEFWSRTFQVNNSVLIPRPETEFLLEKVINSVKGKPLPQDGTIFDLCCGSGVIAIILALELQSRVVALDLSENALAVARENCVRHGVQERVELLHSDLFAAIPPTRSASLVVTNPPYVARQAIENDLEPEVVSHEPIMALDGGEKGLVLIERIRHQLPGILMPGGRLFMEIGYDQGQAVKEMFLTATSGRRDFEKVEIFTDYAGLDRVVYAVAAQD